MYLLQLVQALKFDKPMSRSAGRLAGSATGDRDTEARRLLNTRNAVNSPSGSLTNDAPGDEGSGLTDFLIRRGVSNPLLGNNLYWYLEVECEDPKTGPLFKAVKKAILGPSWRTTGRCRAQRHAVETSNLARNTIETGKGAAVESRCKTEEDRKAACAYCGSEKRAKSVRSASYVAARCVDLGDRYRC